MTFRKFESPEDFRAIFKDGVGVFAEITYDEGTELKVSHAYRYVVTPTSVLNLSYRTDNGKPYNYTHTTFTREHDQYLYYALEVDDGIQDES